MIATNPIEINGQTFDRWSINLAISSKYTPSGDFDASVAMRLVPTRLVPATTDADGNTVSARVETADEAAVGVLRGRMSEVHPGAEATAVDTIYHAVAEYLKSNNL